jgi:hypothetical protein
MVAMGLAIVGIVVFFFIYKPPTCLDGKQNQNETGIDCGGSCTYLCTATLSPATVRFVRPLSPQPSRTDVLAYIDNPNQNAAVRNAHYTLELYDANQNVVSKRDGSIDLPPGSTVPLFLPAVYVGPADIAQAFLTLDPESFKWFHADPLGQLPSATNVTLTEGSGAPRLTATLTNPSADPLYNVKVTAVLYGADSTGSGSTVIAASQTLVPGVPGQRGAPLVFTWNQPFNQTVVRTEILSTAPVTGP